MGVNYPVDRFISQKGSYDKQCDRIHKGCKDLTSLITKRVFDSILFGRKLIGNISNQ